MKNIDILFSIESFFQFYDALIIKNFAFTLNLKTILSFENNY